jgi:hypothetical protein
MKYLAAALVWLCIALIQPARADNEIGYVEDFIGQASNYTVERGSEIISMKLLMPVYSGDRIETLSEKGRVSLRLVDHPEPVVLSRADNGKPIPTLVPQEGFWSSVLTSTLAAISPFDQQKRERVLTAIRGDEGEFGVPLLQTRQILASGQRSIALGWLKSTAVTEITITRKNGKKLVAKGKGVGGLWISPAIPLKPGPYRITVSAGNDSVTGEVEVIKSEDLPQLPADLTRGSIPEALRRVAQATWLAAQDKGQYRIEALQLIANDRSRPAVVLTDALISGQSVHLPQ